MRVSIVVPDAMVIVDGVARKVSMADIEIGIHAVQWDGTSGDVEYGKPNQHNVAITDLTPFQFLVDRWTAAAPIVLPPPPPPTKDDKLAQTLSDPVLAALISEVAALKGVTDAKFLEDLKATMK